MQPTSSKSRWLLKRWRLVAVVFAIAGLCLFWWFALRKEDHQGLASVKRGAPQEGRRDDRIGNIHGPVPARGKSEPMLPEQTGPDSAGAIVDELATVCLQDSQGDALAGLRFSVYCSDTASMLGVGVHEAGEDGCAQIERCPGENIETCVRLQSTRFRSTQSWTLGSSPRAVFTAKPVSAIEGRVLDEQNQPIVAASIRVIPTDVDPYAAPPFVVPETKSDVEGEFWIGRALPAPCDACVEHPETCDEERSLGADAIAGTLFISHPEYRPLEIHFGDLAQSALELHMLGPLSPVRGRVLDPDGVPYSRLVVQLRGQANGQTKSPQHFAVEANADGSFEVPGVGDVDYRLEAYQDGHAIAAVDDVHSGDNLNLRGSVRVTRETIRVQLVDANGQPVVGARVFGGPFRGQTSDERGEITQAGAIVGEFEAQIEAPRGRGRKRVRARVHRDGTVVPPSWVFEG